MDLEKAYDRVDRQAMWEVPNQKFMVSLSMIMRGNGWLSAIINGSANDRQTALKYTRLHVLCHR
jgi:hypothetical protein